MSNQEGNKPLLPQYLISQVIENAIRGYAVEKKIPPITGKAIREKSEWLPAFNQMIKHMNRREVARLAVISLDKTEKEFGSKLKTDRETVKRFLSDEASDEDIRAAYQQIARIPDANMPEIARIVEKTVSTIYAKDAK